jgi:hypothetical protein
MFNLIVETTIPSKETLTVNTPPSILSTALPVMLNVIVDPLNICFGLCKTEIGTILGGGMFGHKKYSTSVSFFIIYFLPLFLR